MILSLYLLISCTDNEIAKTMGGSMTVNVPCDQKLVMVTWKDTELWYQTRPMRTDEIPENQTFREKLTYGFAEGNVILTESRCTNKVSP